MKSTAYGLAEMIALLGINPDSSLDTLVEGRKLIEGQRLRLEELVSRVEGPDGLTDFRMFIEELDVAIRQRSIGSKAFYDPYSDAFYLNRRGKLSPVHLTPPERAVLEYLMLHPNERLTFRSIADGAGLKNSKRVSRYIQEIRLKLWDTDPYRPKYIRIEGESNNRTYMFIAKK